MPDDATDANDPPDGEGRQPRFSDLLGLEIADVGGRPQQPRSSR